MIVDCVLEKIVDGICHSIRVIDTVEETRTEADNTKSGSGSKDSESDKKLNSSEKKVYKSKVISPFFMVGL